MSEKQSYIKVNCCMCHRRVMMKPGKVANGDVSHGFCQECYDTYCTENFLPKTKITIPKGAIVNHECV